MGPVFDYVAQFMCRCLMLVWTDGVPISPADFALLTTPQAENRQLDELLTTEPTVGQHIVRLKPAPVNRIRLPVINAIIRSSRLHRSGGRFLPPCESVWAAIT